MCSLWSRRCVLSVLCSAVLLPLAGCSSEDRIETAQVYGVVTYNGEPLKIGSLLFVPDGGGPSAEANINEQGKYWMGTYEMADGAILGTHKVIITAITSPGGSGLPEDVIDGDGAPVSVIPEFYGDLTKSGLSVDVKSGENKIDFVLTSKVGEVKVN